MASWIGIDIGGANLKIANSDMHAISMPFHLWKQPDELGASLARLLQHMPPFQFAAMTMTGELADCYQTREEGVCRILEQVTSVLPAPLVRVYSVDGEWQSVSQAARQPWSVAASNWHALAQYCLRHVGASSTLLVDIGSTTCDIIPFAKGKISTQAVSDSQRLLLRQLIYTGIERTPVCAVTSALPLHGELCPVMAEFFATMQDVYLWLGELIDRPNQIDTADGRPATRYHAGYRLARMVGEDGTSLTPSELDEIATAAAESQAKMLAQGIEVQRQQLGTSKVKKLVVSGHGHFLLDAALRILDWQPERIELSQKLGDLASRCAPSIAVACLAAEQLGSLNPADEQHG